MSMSFYFLIYTSALDKVQKSVIYVNGVSLRPGTCFEDREIRLYYPKKRWCLQLCQHRACFIFLAVVKAGLQ
jgi:hypothetical protein